MIAARRTIVCPGEARIEVGDHPKAPRNPRDEFGEWRTSGECFKQARNRGGPAQYLIVAHHEVERGVSLGDRDPVEETEVVCFDKRDEIYLIPEVQEVDEFLESRATTAIGIVRQNETGQSPSPLDEVGWIVKGVPASGIPALESRIPRTQLRVGRCRTPLCAAVPK